MRLNISMPYLYKHFSSVSNQAEVNVAVTAIPKRLLYAVRFPTTDLLA